MTERVDDPSLPAVHVLHLVELVQRWHVEPDELLAGLGLDREALADPAARLGLPTVIALVERARLLTGEPALGFYLGLQMRISWHGFLGFAAMASATIGEALRIAERFAPTRTTAIGLRLHVEGGRATLVIDERAPLGAARDAILLALLTGIWTIGNTLTGRILQGSADLAFPEPDYVARFVRLLPGMLRFGQPAHQLVFDAAVLDLPLTMADPVAQRLAREQCQRELDALGFDGQVAARVRALLPADDAGFRSIDAVAERMHVSERTLKRRLAAIGTSFTELLDEVRREKAILLLRAGELSVDEVGERLGYSDPANFARAFRRWTGTTPRAFRRG